MRRKLKFGIWSGFAVFVVWVFFSSVFIRYSPLALIVLDVIIGLAVGLGVGVSVALFTAPAKDKVMDYMEFPS